MDIEPRWHVCWPSTSNETLLDLRSLDPLFLELLGEAELRGQTFARCSSSRSSARSPGATSLQAPSTPPSRCSRRRTGNALTDADADRIVDAMRWLEPHADAAPALARLRDAGYTLAALTNSPADVSHDQLRHAELDGCFDAILSADEVRALKPRREPYELVAPRFWAEPGTSAHRRPCVGHHRRARPPAAGRRLSRDPAWC